MKAELFIIDGDQAVNLPDEFRFEGEYVYIMRVGDSIILSPCDDSEETDSEQGEK